MEKPPGGADARTQEPEHRFDNGGYLALGIWILPADAPDDDLPYSFFVGLTDVFVAGFISPNVQAAVGFVTQLYFIVVILANAISIGILAMISRAVGAAQLEKAVSIAKQSLILGCLIALILAIRRVANRVS